MRLFRRGPVARGLRFVFPSVVLFSAAFSSASNPDVNLVQKYVKEHASDTFRNATGILSHPYLVPAGPYEQCWDWDAMFTGVALLELGSAPYLAGSMMNFFEATDLSTGEVTQCLDPATSAPSCSSSNETAAVANHAKPILIQGAYFAARHTGDFAVFEPYRPAMEALLGFWERERRDGSSGLYTWHDQMESGADNLVTSECPTSRSDCWDEATDANTLAAADTTVELLRERRAFASFLEAWASPAQPPATSAEGRLGGGGGEEEGGGFGGGGQGGGTRSSASSLKRAAAAAQRAAATTDAAALNAHLWDESQGMFVALNTSTQMAIPNSVYLGGFPLWGGAGVVAPERAAAVAARLSEPDLLTPFGLRSTSSFDPRYSNENTITPYSNWRGPVWVVSNAVVAYGLRDHGFLDLAAELANRTVAVLAADLRATGTWHECYSSDTGTAGDGGTGLAADGFLSWNTLGYRLMDDLEAGVNPFSIA